MKPKSIMLIAGEPSGDMHAAELVYALRAELTAADARYTTDSQPLLTGLEPRFFGAGGPRMAAAGVELEFDLTEDSITGMPGLKDYVEARRRFQQLLQLAIERQPDVIVGVDYNYFNLRFAEAIRRHTNRLSGWFQDWHPKLVKYISPQVWASREGRAFGIARDYDLLMTIFPFEKDWYARRVPKLRVEFVGHPLVERYLKSAVPGASSAGGVKRILLLPGSRKGEVRRHVPVMLDALKLIQKRFPEAQGKMILPTQTLADIAKSSGTTLEIQIGGLWQALSKSDIAITKTGTVTLECALFGVPAVTMYKAFWGTYQLGKRIVKVNSLTMPNLMAKEEVFPEFIQDAATPENISRVALELLENESVRKRIKTKLAEVVAMLGGPGASQRAARAITDLLEPKRGERIRG